MTVRSCVCGYFVDDEEYAVEIPVYYQSGKHKGELKTTYTEYQLKEPTKEFFKGVKIEKSFSFVCVTNSSWSSYEQDVRLFACPVCKTVKLEEYQ